MTSAETPADPSRECSTKGWKQSMGPIMGFRTGGGYSGDLFAEIFAVYGCTYLLAAWLVFGLTKLARQLMIDLLPNEGNADDLRN